MLQKKHKQYAFTMGKTNTISARATETRVAEYVLAPGGLRLGALRWSARFSAVRISADIVDEKDDEILGFIHVYSWELGKFEKRKELGPGIAVFSCGDQPPPFAVAPAGCAYPVKPVVFLRNPVRCVLCLLLCRACTTNGVV